MDSGLGSDDEKRSRTKAQKQLQNEQKQLFSGCFIDATTLGDEAEPQDFECRQSDERRQGALIFKSSIPQYSMLQMPRRSSQTDSDISSSVQDDDVDNQSSEVHTPHNSIVQVEERSNKKLPVGFYIDLENVGIAETPPAAPIQKKNIFSMVIDFNLPKREMPSRLCSSLHAGRNRSNSNTSFSSENDNSSLESNLVFNGKSSIHSEKASLKNSQRDRESPQHPTICTSVERINKACNTKNTDEGMKCPIKNKVQDVVAAQQFVKLADLEKQTPKLDLFIAPRMSRSIPEKSWVESPLVTFRSASYRTGPQPFEPELEKPVEPCTLSPKRTVKKLGTDLLRMFLEEIGTDTIIEVNTRRVRAHRCILISRCQYFAAVLGGNPSETVVNIQGYSFAAVHFALCHIYSGAAHVPESISLVELAALSDMLGLEGLKEVTAHALKVRFCHSYHEPCSGCTIGVMEVLPLSITYGLDDLYRECLCWIKTNFVEVWPSKAFTSLPLELRDKCYRQHVIHMSPDNVIDTILNCDKLIAAIPASDWVAPIVQLTLQLADACQIYLRRYFSAVLINSSFLALDSNKSEYISHLEESFISAANALKLDQACRSYISINKMLQKTWSIPFSSFLRKIYNQIETGIVRHATPSSRSAEWLQLDPSLRRRIRELTLTASIQMRAAQHTKTLTQNTGIQSSPNSTLRQSLLLAARSHAPNSPSSTRSQAPSSPLSMRSQASNSSLSTRSQVTTSPLLNKRSSTLTNPTRSSAAKNKPKPAVEQMSTSMTLSRRIPVIIKGRTRPATALAISSDKVSLKKIESGKPASSNTVTRKIIPNKTVKKSVPGPKSIKEPPATIKPTICRSDTFLKEPTVLLNIQRTASYQQSHHTSGKSTTSFEHIQDALEGNVKSETGDMLSYVFVQYSFEKEGKGM